MNKKAAIYCISSRKEFLEKALVNSYDNWNSVYDYPVYIHYWGKIYDDKKYVENIQSKISNKIKFIKIDVKIPDYLEEKDLFYNRNYNPYVKKKFTKKRVGYLHMLRFAINVTSFGEIGCLGSELKNYDYLMRIDDDSWFKKKIEFDLFNENYILASGFSAERVPLKVRKNCSENLFNFYKYYLKKYNVFPKSEYLSEVLKNNDEDKFLQLPLPAGNLNIYNIKKFLEYPWQQYLKEVNNYAGDYKYRWTDNDVIGVFAHTYFNLPIYNYDLVKKGYYIPEFPEAGLAPNPEDKKIYYSNTIIYRLIKFLYRFVRNIFK